MKDVAGGKPIPKRPGMPSMKPKKQRFPGQIRTTLKKTKSVDRNDFVFSSASPIEETAILDPETGTFIFPDKEKTPVEDSPYPPEQW